MICFGYISPSSGALDVELQHMVYCTEFLEGWWSWEPLRRSCVRCGWCRASHGTIRTVHTTYAAALKTTLLAPWCRVLLEKLSGLQLVKKFHAFHGTRRFITALTSVRHVSLSWASPIHSIYPHPPSWRSILILSTHLRLGLPSGLLPSGFPTKTLYTTLSSPIRATCSAHLILLDFITRTILGEQYKPFSSSLCNLLHSPVTSSLLGPNILLNTIFSNTLSFLSSCNVSDQLSHPYTTHPKIRYRKPFAASQHLMLLMMGVCTRNMSS